MEDLSEVEREALKASQEWVKAFNSGDIDFCVSSYTENALMQATPFGSFEGKNAISKFWYSLVRDKKATDLEYKRIKVNVLSQNLVVLSATWSMNIGEGVITCEKWCRSEKGRFLLAQDFFELIQ